MKKSSLFTAIALVATVSLPAFADEDVTCGDIVSRKKIAVVAVRNADFALAASTPILEKVTLTKGSKDPLIQRAADGKGAILKNCAATLARLGVHGDVIRSALEK